LWFCLTHYYSCACGTATTPVDSVLHLSAICVSPDSEPVLPTCWTMPAYRRLWTVLPFTFTTLRVPACGLTPVIHRDISLYLPHCSATATTCAGPAWWAGHRGCLHLCGTWTRHLLPQAAATWATPFLTMLATFSPKLLLSCLPTFYFSVYLPSLFLPASAWAFPTLPRLPPLTYLQLIMDCTGFLPVTLYHCLYLLLPACLLG
jgi:hypothetical protein